MSAEQTLPIRAVVIDDDPTVAQQVRDWLGRHEVAVQGCLAAAEGRTLLARQRCELVLVDLALPDCDETELIDHTRQSQPHAAVLALATFPEPEQIERALSAGALGVVAKPLREQVLLEHVRAALRQIGLYETRESRFNRRLGERIRALRRQRGLAQQTLAQAVGLSPGQLSHIESGRTGTTVWRLARIAAALRMPLHALLEEL